MHDPTHVVGLLVAKSIFLNSYLSVPAIPQDAVLHRNPTHDWLSGLLAYFSCLPFSIALFLLAVLEVMWSSFWDYSSDEGAL